MKRYRNNIGITPTTRGVERAAAAAGTTPTAANSPNVKAGLKRRIILQNKIKYLVPKYLV
jgi:hypothetical protein